MELTGASSGNAITDGSGNYTFDNLANGSYTITPSKTGFTFIPTDNTQTVSGADITGVDFTATATALSTFVTMFASLDNTQETTGSTSSGLGGGILGLDNATGKVRGFVVSTGVDNVTGAHVHLGARGVPGDILVDLAPVDLPSATLYTVPDQEFFPDPTGDVASYLAGDLYFNVHNDTFPFVVIRGQIDVP